MTFSASTRLGHPRVPVQADNQCERPLSSRDRAIVGLLFVVLCVVYGAVSLQRHRLMLTTGFDLGIFEQEVRSYASGHLPTSLLKGPDYPLLGDHFSPIVALIAPFYALFPGAGTLLVAQALLFALGVVPLTAWAVRRLGWGAASVVTLGYALSWGIARALAFDFHEIAFAVPLVAFSLAALGQGRLRAAVLWALPLVLVKEDLGLTVAMIGLLVMWRARHSRVLRRWGGAAVVFGAAATTIEMLVVIPAINPAGSNAYAGQLTSGGLLTHLTSILTPDTKIVTLVLLLAPTAFLALRSPLLLAAVPTLAWRFLSDNPYYWGTSFHYSAVLMPIVFAAFIEALTRVDRRQVWMTGGTALTLLMFISSPLAPALRPSFWTTGPRIAMITEALQRIPDNVTVAASNSLVPQLTGRDHVSLFGGASSSTARPQFIVADTSAGASQFPISSGQATRLLALAETDGYRVVVEFDDFTLLEAHS